MLFFILTFGTTHRRNEQIIGSRVAVDRQPGAITIKGDDPKKFAAAMVEYSKVIDGHVPV